MTRQRYFILISLALLTACAQSGENSVVKGERQASSTLTVQANQPADASETTAGSELDEAFQVVKMRWVPGKTSKVPFDIRSRIRARADRLSSDVLVLAIDTAPEIPVKRTMPRYVVADSAVITGLRRSDVFTEYCKVDSAVPNGRVGGLVSGEITDRPQRARLAWRFDAQALRIRSIPPDSVSCILLEPD